MDKDYYKILGVNESDTAENIKTAYRKLARKWHPDVAGNSPDILLKFKEINEAYDALTKNGGSSYNSSSSYSSNTSSVVLLISNCGISLLNVI